MSLKVSVAMSGGVDSSVAAFLLKQKGCDCEGVTLKLFDGDDKAIFKERNCGSDEDIEDAKRVCERLGIPHSVVNLEDSFKKCVMENFACVYSEGGVPNPCIECNKHIKFKGVFESAESRGYTHIATGHYCSIEKDSQSGRYLLKKAVDNVKDQTYMLYSLNQQILSRVVFPLGGMTKEQVRELAIENGFVNARKKDSQDICFIKDGNYGEFLRRFTGKPPREGMFVLPDGQKLCKHGGFEYYTVGQRKGLGIAYEHPLYVLKKDVNTGDITVGKSEELFSSRVVVGNINLIAYEKITSPVKVTAKLRYSQSESPCTLHPLDDGKILLEFSCPQRAVTPGQSAVLYDGEYCVGGGIIEGAE